VGGRIYLLVPPFPARFPHRLYLPVTRIFSMASLLFPFPDLPIDVARLILEETVWQDSPGTHLALVSRAVRAWYVRYIP